MEWDISNDPDRLSEVLDLASSEGPQTIVNGDRRYTIFANRDPAKREPPKTFKEWILNGPRIGDLDISRDKSPMREIDL